MSIRLYTVSTYRLVAGVIIRYVFPMLDKDIGSTYKYQDCGNKQNQSQYRYKDRISPHINLVDPYLNPNLTKMMVSMTELIRGTRQQVQNWILIQEESIKMRKCMMTMMANILIICYFRLRIYYQFQKSCQNSCPQEQLYNAQFLEVLWETTITSKLLFLISTQIQAIMTDHVQLKSIFLELPNLAWDILEAESYIYLSSNIQVTDIKRLSQLYLRVIERLNSLQDNRQKFFVDRMQRLMSEPYVIRCFNNQIAGKQGPLDSKRKSLEQALCLEIQKNKPELLKHAIKQQQQKEKKMSQKINSILQRHEKKLELRLKKRESAKHEKTEEGGSQRRRSKDSEKFTQLNPQGTNRKMRKVSSEILNYDPSS